MQIRWLLVALLLLATVRASAETPAPVTMMTNTWPPYVDAQLPEGGLALELVTQASTESALDSKEITVQTDWSTIGKVRGGWL